MIDADPFVSNPLFAAVLNQDGTFNSQGNPAAAGTIISVFGTGFGQLVGPSVVDGALVMGTKNLVNPIEVLN